MRSFKLRIMAQVLPFLLVAPVLAPAQTPPSRSEATAAMKAGQHDTKAQYTKQQIDQLIAPIALYPDQLLAQVLMAATYPQQLVEAAEWLNDPQHAALKGDELAQALADLPWDPSVKALVAFPQIIAMLTEHLEWTQALGLAFATQQAQVMDRVQGLRQLAVKSGRIKNMKHVTVRKEANAITIVSAEPDRVFVPVYNPRIVYGQWPDPRHPPVYVAPPRRFASEAREMVFETVEPGIEVLSYPVVQPLWGWTQPDWGSRRITIKTEEYTRITRGVRPPPNNVWHREGPIVIVTPSAAPSPNPPPVPTGTVAPAQAVTIGVLKERAASHPDKIRVETPPPAAARPENPQAQQPRPEKAQAQQPQAEKAQAQQPRPETTKAQQPQPDRPQAQQPRPETTQAQQPQPDKPQAQQPRPEKAQAQQPQPDKPQAQQPRPEKAQAQQPQPDKPQAQQPRPEKAQAQQPQPDKPQAQQPRPEKAQAQQPQPDKPQAQQPRPEKAQAQQPQPDKPQAQQPRPEKAQAQQPRPEKAQAQQPQPDKPQAQQPRPEKAQAQQPQPDKPQAAAKTQAEKAQAEKAETEKARARGHGPANAAAPADRVQNQAGPAAGRRPGTAAETPGQGSSGPPGPATSPRGQGAAPERHSAPAHADPKDMDKKER